MGIKKERCAVARLKATVFFTLLGVFCVVGFLWFLRPAESTAEKRKLTPFPAFSWQTLWDGAFFAGMDTWYSDTYPLREPLIIGNRWVRSLYGDRTTQFIHAGESAEEIPADDPREESAGPANREEASAESKGSTGAELPDGTVKAPGELAGSIYITEGCGYGLYYFTKDTANEYADILNRCRRNLAEGTNLYCLIAPINSGVMLDLSLQKSFGASDQSEAIRYMYGRMESGIRTVDAIGNLRRHNAEYVYFHTDHHWTALGAYYAYEAFAGAKGVPAHTLGQFAAKEFPDFLGTYYTSTQSQELGRNPDTIVAYLPMATNEMSMTTADGKNYTWRVVNDVTSYPQGEKYACFAGGDQPISHVHNPTLSDGSSCLIIKDSYGNAMIPFLVDHYEDVYWIDFRYYKGTVPALVQEKGIRDVIFLTNIYNTSSAKMLPLLRRLAG